MNEKSFHIIFPPKFYQKELGFRSRNHFSWSLTPLDKYNFEFGGEIKSGINRLIKFTEKFEANYCKLEGIEFGINFEEFFNAQIQGEHLFYEHKSDGSIVPLTNNIKIQFPYSNHPLKEIIIKLAETPNSLENQEWLGNSNKIGGKPIWVQESEELRCPKCKERMLYLFQLDSGLPDLNDCNCNEIMFGNDGILYAFWCNKDMISGYLWQCT